MNARPTIRTASPLIAIVAVLIGTCLAGTAGAAESEAGASWVQKAPSENPPARHGASMAFDQATGQLVLFGGSAGGTDLADTWTYDGTTWTKASPSESPPARHGASMAFDQATGQLVLFGGSAGGADLGDTWSYDGTTWTKQSPSTSPSARHGASAAFDLATGKVVLFGGSAGGTDLADTWTFSSGTWTQQSPSAGPSARDGASIAFDLDSGRLVLFGGTGPEGLLADTWTYDGTNWAQVAPTAAPGARKEAAMTFDQTIGKTILVGGDGGARLGDVWTYEKGNWARQAVAPTPPARAGASMDFDPATGQTVLFDGAGQGGDLADTWNFGSPPGPAEQTGGRDFAWYQQSTESAPSERSDAAMAFDPTIGQIVLYGGSGQGLPPTATWTYDGDNWIRHLLEPRPSLSGSSAMAFDPALGKMVLFGGTSAYESTVGETWTFDGSGWTKLAPPQSPPALWSPSMAFDPVTGQLVLYGRNPEETYENQTWTFDGTTWQRLQQEGGPYGLGNVSIAFDPAIGKIVLFGEREPRPEPFSGETWVYGADGWTEEWAGGPSVSNNRAMTFDSTSGEILLLASGASGPSGLSRDVVWAFDGNRWQVQDPANPPYGRSSSSFVFDPATGRSVRFGDSGYGDPAETWTYQRAAVGPTPGSHPIARISGPVDPDVEFGKTVESRFHCSEINGEPGVRSCTDSEGASEPHGTIDTSTLGEHIYTVTAVSKDGSVGIGELLYIVKKRPTLTVHAPKSVLPGEEFTATATLSGGAAPSGRLTFGVYGPNGLHCHGMPLASQGIEVTGNGTYEMTSPVTAARPGFYSVAALYRGDHSNFEVHSECDEAENTVTVGKVTTATKLEVNPSPARPGDSVLLAAHVAGSDPTGTITFKDGSRVLRVIEVDPFRATASVYENLTEGKHLLTAVYSGDEVNPPSSSPVFEEVVAKDPPPPPEPEEGPVLPVEPEVPVIQKPREPNPPDEPLDPVPAIPLPSLSVAPTASPAPSPTPAPLPVATDTGIAVSYRVHRPPASRRDPLYTFVFTSQVPGPRFSCGVDKAVLAPCSSPTTYRHLARGLHRFVVKAIGTGGVEPVPRVVRFFVGGHVR